MTIQSQELKASTTEYKRTADAQNATEKTLKSTAIINALTSMSNYHTYWADHSHASKKESERKMGNLNALIKSEVEELTGENLDI